MTHYDFLCRTTENELSRINEKIATNAVEIDHSKVFAREASDRDEIDQWEKAIPILESLYKAQCTYRDQIQAIVNQYKEAS